ncbi:MAG: hypothetical protein U0704_04565 [Candidatus Eisenbacteria bacterium]
MRLDLLKSTEIPGTPGTPSGVAPDDVHVPAGLESAPAPVQTGGSWRRALLVLLAAASLLGQGERFRVDPRFRAPSTTLLAYWEALRQGDGDTAYECFVEGRHDLPMPGALWFLPPTDDLWLTGFRSLPVTAGRVMVTYEVHYRPRGSGEERMFKTGSELVRTHGEWRISQPLGEVSMPEWKGVPGPIDT